MGKEQYQKPEVTPLKMADLLTDLKTVTSKARMKVDEIRSHREALEARVNLLSAAMEDVTIQLAVADRVVNRFDALIELRERQENLR